MLIYKTWIWILTTKGSISLPSGYTVTSSQLLQLPFCFSRSFRNREICQRLITTLSSRSSSKELRSSHTELSITVTGSSHHWAHKRNLWRRWNCWFQGKKTARGCGPLTQAQSLLWTLGRCAACQRAPSRIAGGRKFQREIIPDNRMKPLDDRLITTFGLYGGVILLWYRSSQFMGEKNTWYFTSSWKKQVYIVYYIYGKWGLWEE